MPLNPNIALMPMQGVQNQGQAIDGAFNAYRGAQQNKRQNALLNLQTQNQEANQARSNALLDIQKAQEARAAASHQQSMEAGSFELDAAKGNQVYKALSVLKGLPTEDRAGFIETLKPGLSKLGFDDDDWEMLGTDEGLDKGIQFTSQFAQGKNSETDPANVREYEFFNKLSPEQKEEFLVMKRASPTFKAGDVQMKGSQLGNNAQPFNIDGATPTQAEAQQVITGQQATKKATEAAAVDAISQSKEAFERIAPIKQGIANYSEVERLIDEGAETGVIASRLPSMKQASIELDNLQGKLGLDVIGNTTFGALSESELKFALDTALPKNLEGPALKEWVQRKKSAQEKLLAYTEQAATYLGTPGNTIAGWVETQKQQNQASNIEDLVNKYAN